jgi:gliding motility-associated-like protein
MIVLDKNIKVFVPNIFTPNGDNLNDILFVYGNQIKTMELKVYDRWGEEIFVTDDMSKGWDGTYRGKPMNSDVFVYHLSATLLDNSQINRDGSVTLVR